MDDIEWAPPLTPKGRRVDPGEDSDLLIQPYLRAYVEHRVKGIMAEEPLSDVLKRVRRG